MTDVLFSQVLAVVGVGRVTNVIEPLEEFVHFTLREPNVEIDGVVGRRAAMQLPAAVEVPLCIRDAKCFHRR